MNSVRVQMAFGMVVAGVLAAASGTALGQSAAGQHAATAEGVRTAEGGQLVVGERRSPRQSKIERYGKVLGLDEAQLEVAKDLNTAYEQSMAEAGKTMRAAMKDAQSDMNDGDHSAFQKKMQTTMKAHDEASRALSEEFLSDLRTLLRPDQEGNWVKLERLRRRERVLASPMGGGQSLGGSGVDLIPMIGRLEVPAETKPKVEELLGLYEIDIDRPLQERERNLDEDRETMGAVRQFTPESFKKQQQRDRAVDVKVREVNDKYVRLIGAELPEALGAKLSEEYRAKAYRSAYRPTSVGRELAAAEKLKGLSEKQREQLKAMNERYKQETKAAGDRLAAAMRRAEDEGKTLGGPLMMGPGAQNDVDPQVAEARSQRRELDTKLRDAMEKLLSPEQLADARDAAKPQGIMGQRVEVFGTGHGEDVMFTSEIELDEDFEPGEGGGAMVIIQSVETVVPVQGEPARDPR